MLRSEGWSAAQSFGFPARWGRESRWGDLLYATGIQANRVAAHTLQMQKQGKRAMVSPQLIDAMHRLKRVQRDGEGNTLPDIRYAAWCLRAQWIDGSIAAECFFGSASNGTRAGLRRMDMKTHQLRINGGGVTALFGEKATAKGLIKSGVVLSAIRATHLYRHAYPPAGKFFLHILLRTHGPTSDLAPMLGSRSSGRREKCSHPGRPGQPSANQRHATIKAH